ncbi:hypothetical protein [Membranihabitans maritimus]|uniref:hypothetical protein n=1 Tax=Membranihabitans maritimus TaxID=2904244 RepID=UPI001F32F73E|nr:hypothetical protein [Membranihabitans maritimus]
MKRILIFLALSITCTIYTNGQNFVFVGEHSFQSTEPFTLQSNSDSDRINDLNIVFAKDGTKGLLVISSKLVSTVRISGKLIIYLNDGTVITCIDKGINDNVDGIATSAYYLTNEELAKMKKSNIHTIRYEIKCAECLSNVLYEGNYSASNKGESEIDYTTVMNKFFNE